MLPALCHLALYCQSCLINKVTFLSFLCSVTVELIQLVSKLGSCDVDDVILNTLGGLLGYIMFCICIGIIHIFTGKKKH